MCAYEAIFDRPFSIENVLSPDAKASLGMVLRAAPCSESHVAAFGGSCCTIHHSIGFKIAPGYAPLVPGIMTIKEAGDARSGLLV